MLAQAWPSYACAHVGACLRPKLPCRGARGPSRKGAQAQCLNNSKTEQHKNYRYKISSYLSLFLLFLFCFSIFLLLQPCLSHQSPVLFIMPCLHHSIIVSPCVNCISCQSISETIRLRVSLPVSRRVGRRPVRPRGLGCATSRKSISA